MASMCLKSRTSLCVQSQPSGRSGHRRRATRNGFLLVITDGSGPGAVWGPRARILEQDRGSRSKAAGHGWSSGIDTERKAFSFVIQVTNGTGPSGSSPPRPFGVKPGRPLSFADQGRPRPRRELSDCAGARAGLIVLDPFYSRGRAPGCEPCFQSRRSEAVHCRAAKGRPKAQTRLVRRRPSTL